ncbi:MAG: DegT/DnrJ/EryC1/StrS family aminotransferase [Candidatus Nitrosotenuis sp.]
MNTKKEDTGNWKLPLYKIYSDDEDLNLITKIIRRGTNWAIGPEIEEFEKAICDYVGRDYCITLNSGTSALHGIFLAYGIGRGDEVVVPSFSFISTANSVLFVNANTKFADIEETTYGLDPSRIQEKITSKTKAVVPVDYGGLSCKIFDIKEICESNNILLIEDAAESLGSSVNGKKVGSVGDCAIFSFCGNKVLTTGEGGAVVTNSKTIYEKLKLIRSHGRVDKTNYFDNPDESQYEMLGYNWRISTITAALGISQIRKLNKIIKMRQDNAKYLSSRLSRHPEITVPTSPNGFEHIYQMYTIRLPDKKLRDSLHQYLSRKRIFSKVYFTPIHLTTFYQQKFGMKKSSLPVTERVSEQVLTLPMYPNMNNEEKDYLIDSVDEFFDLVSKTS